MRIATVVGARPQFIKAAVVSRALMGVPEATEIMIHTGQHYDANMSDVFFDELEIPRPRYNLAIGSISHGAQTGRMLEAIENILLSEHPQAVLVYGDTNSTLAGALAAVKLKIPVAHVEAGLRSFDSRMPEEINRLLTDHVSALLFAPTKRAVQNLQQEGIADHRISMSGDVMCDALQYYGTRADTRSTDLLRQLGLTSKQYVLTTLHRASNTEQPARLCKLFQALAQACTGLSVVFPMHPRTRNVLVDAGMLDEILRLARVISPLSYIDMMVMEKHARLVATDSGGVQKEAFLHRVPCVTLREQTEWTELVDLGWNRLANPADLAAIKRTVQHSLDHVPDNAESPYGDGHAGERIAKAMLALGQAEHAPKSAVEAVF